MAPRYTPRRNRVQERPSPFVKVDAWQAPSGRHLVSGETTFSVEGEPGRFVFLAHVTGRHGEEWLDAFGPLPRGKDPLAAHLRSFAVERLKTVHRTPYSRAAKAAA